jgi:hypothetical protein
MFTKRTLPAMLFVWATAWKRLRQCGGRYVSGSGLHKVSN